MPRRRLTSVYLWIPHGTPAVKPLQNQFSMNVCSLDLYQQMGISRGWHRLAFTRKNSSDSGSGMLCFLIESHWLLFIVFSCTFIVHVIWLCLMSGYFEAMACITLKKSFMWEFSLFMSFYLQLEKCLDYFRHLGPGLVMLKDPFRLCI